MSENLLNETPATPVLKTRLLCLCCYCTIVCAACGSTGSRMLALGGARLGVSTFFASTLPHDVCGSNGLPLTPNSIRILGRFQVLRTLSNPGLCQYLDIVRSKHERLIVVAEHYDSSVESSLEQGVHHGVQEVLRVAQQVLQALEFLHSRGFVHAVLAPRNILITPSGHVKLAKFGLHYMTGGGADVDFPIGYPAYLAPEVVAQGVRHGVGNAGGIAVYGVSPKSDLWALGLVLLEMLAGRQIWKESSVVKTLTDILKLGKQTDISSSLLAQFCSNRKDISDDILQILRSCLVYSPTQRAMAAELLQRGVFEEVPSTLHPTYCSDFWSADGLRCANLELTTCPESVEDADLLAERSLDEVYHLWGLAGGDLERELVSHGIICCKPAVCTLPNLVLEAGEVYGQARDRSWLLNDTTVTLSISQLRTRLQDVPGEVFFPLLEEEDVSLEGTAMETARLPLVIRERDTEYQLFRLVLLRRLLQAYPYKCERLWKEARVDIPPLLRGHIWAALLGVKGNIHRRYEAIDKDTPIQTDRQIEVDVPRCHQYNELLSSPEGHTKFKHILKAWVVAHPQLVYWQGLDSLCAPFLFLNFNNEALAYACMSAFVPKYLRDFFLKDNSHVIQEYLMVFSQLIAFHDPELSNHLNHIKFIPDLYAIPWFLTMFTHVFPLHKIFHLWDTLLLGNHSFPLSVGVAILQQLRARLLASAFNDCILLFSDLPEVDIERCVRDSTSLFCCTPRSATFRQHACPPRSPQNSVRSPSYISGTYANSKEPENNGLGRDTVPISELKMEICPRISAEELLELCEPARSRSEPSEGRRSRGARPRALVLDVRSADEFSRGHLSGSINIPAGTALTPGGALCPAASNSLAQQRGRVIVLVGNASRTAATVAAHLQRLHYPKVCILDGGISKIKEAGLLTVPSPQI
uniref:TBC domain-containing protein kinase-like protein isoform X2 n=1 Tax=Myxine glutinosa TaxID=7769 RepID=UPI00358E9E24